MKVIFLVIISLVFVCQSLSGQNSVIRIESNKILCLFNFLETSSGKPITSNSFRDYILESYKGSEKFNAIVESYSKLNIEYSIERPEFPEKRFSKAKLRHLLYITASYSNSIDDFNQRIIGLLPHQTQVELIELLTNVEPYYDELIWNKEQNNIKRIENQLADYKIQISELYLKISQFYNTSWSTSIPFKVMLYPIPLEKGTTTALAKGNLLICSFLSPNENDYEFRLGVIIHEMCHILYKAQTVDFQKNIDQWFENSDSPYAPLAYSFIDEALATALGNGWAYEQIHKEVDSNVWYHDIHIDGFAHGIFPLIKQYLKEGKKLDDDFITQSIELFKTTFPRSLEDRSILMFNLQIFANTDEDDEVNQIVMNCYRKLSVRGLKFKSPILSGEAKEIFTKKNKTKLFIVDSDNANTINGLQKYFPTLKVQTPINTFDILKDEQSNSTLIILNIDGVDKLNDALSVLSSLTYLESGKSYEIK